MENDMNEEARKRLEKVVDELIKSKLELYEIRNQLESIDEKIEKLGD